jgi:hypothetical protein
MFELTERMVLCAGAAAAGRTIALGAATSSVASTPRAAGRGAAAAAVVAAIGSGFGRGGSCALGMSVTATTDNSVRRLSARLRRSLSIVGDLAI